METLNDLIAAMADSDATEADKMAVLIAIIDTQKVVDHLKKQSVMVYAGLTSASPSDELAYAVLQIYRPDLFEEA